jgi:broad specificity phosphatase PhoE
LIGAASEFHITIKIKVLGKGNGMTIIYFLRHGETRGNIEKTFRGRTEMPLTDNGRKQTEFAARYLKEKGIDYIYTSPISRAVDTAEAVAKVTGLKPIVNENLIGMNFGMWQGKTHREIEAKHPEDFKKYHEDPHLVSIPGGETFQEVMDRTLVTLEDIRKRHPDDTVLIASHRVIGKVLVLGILGLGVSHFWQIKLDTCSLNQFFYMKKHWIIQRLNDNSYLEDSRRITADF